MRIKLTTLILATIVFGFAGVLSGCGKTASETADVGGQKYHCPMHPTYVSNRPGDCPICNMKLVPIREDATPPKPMTAAPDEKTAHIKLGEYYCPMHPSIISNTPGICPDCEMDLIQKKESAEACCLGEHGGVQSNKPVPGRVSISLSPEKRNLIGLTLATVEQRALARTVRATALVEHDETRYARIAPRFTGWVRDLHVNFTGAAVEKGQPLFSVYSPELFATENEYLSLRRTADQLKPDAPSAQRDSVQNLLEATRLRLALFEVGETEIEQLEQRGKASAELLFRAPFSGHVVVKNAVQGKAFSAGETLYEIADLDHLWLRAYVYEFELPLIAVGQAAEIHFPHLGNLAVNGDVTFIYPHIERQSRRGEIRLEIDNPGQRIRPDMWASVEIHVDSGERLSVPASSVINSGQRYVAFVAGDDQHLEPREVKVGMKTDDYYEVLSGLSQGEKVVSRALFLVDSESQLKSAIAGMISAETHQH